MVTWKRGECLRGKNCRKLITNAESLVCGRIVACKVLCFVCKMDGVCVKWNDYSVSMEEKHLWVVLFWENNLWWSKLTVTILNYIAFLFGSCPNIKCCKTAWMITQYSELTLEVNRVSSGKCCLSRTTTLHKALWLELLCLSCLFL